MTTDYDDTETVIDGVPEQSEQTEETNNEPVDRGDVVSPELEPEALKALVEETKEPEPVVEDEPQKQQHGIPKARFDEVNEARKEYQRQLEEAQREIERLRTPKQEPQQPQAPAFDEDAKEQEYIDAMLEGDIAKAKGIRREINSYLRQQASQQAMEAVENSMSQRQMANALQAESNAAIEAYPYLDTKDGELALKLIIDARDADIKRGVVPHLALRNAVSAIAPRFAPNIEKDSKEVKEAPTRVLTKPVQQTDTRTRDAIKRGADNSMRQPPSMTQGIGNRSTSANYDIDGMDDEQFASLSKAERKRLRGD